jgi:hypothetical protein
MCELRVQQPSPMQCLLAVTDMMVVVVVYLREM